MPESPDDQPSAGAAEEQSSENAEPIIGPPPTTIPEPPPSPPQNHHTAARHRWTHDAPMFWVTLAGVFAVVLYTTVAAWQTCLLSNQLTLTYPPKIRLTTIETVNSADPLIGTSVSGLVFFINVGNAPARLKDSQCKAVWQKSILPISKGNIYGGNAGTYCTDWAVFTDSLHNTKVPDQTIIRPGEMRIGRFIVPKRPTDPFLNIFWVVGFLYFEDLLSPPDRHGVYFARWYDFSKQRFVPPKYGIR